MQAQPLGDIAGFKVAALAVEGHDCRHYLYFRQHFSRTTAEADADKVLFVAGLLPDWTERDVAQLFSAFGKVKSAAISALHSGPTARVAHVTFTTTKAMRAVLAGSKAFPPIQLPSQSVTGAHARVLALIHDRRRRWPARSLGLARATALPGWMEQHKQWRTASQKLKDQVDAYVLGFDAAEEKVLQAVSCQRPRRTAEHARVCAGPRGAGGGEEAHGCGWLHAGDHREAG